MSPKVNHPKFPTKQKPKEKETNVKELEIDPALAADTLKKMTRTNAEAGTLRGLTALINNPEFGEGVEDGNNGKFSAPSVDITEATALHKDSFKTFTVPGPVPDIDEGTIPVPDPMPRTDAPLKRAVAPVKGPAVVFPNHIFTTGRLKAGKDHFLNSIGCKIHGLAEPLYELQRVFFGSDDKSAPGAREFLQVVGQWGRGTVNEKYPLSVSRATFTTMVRAMGPGGLISRAHKVKWENYGKDDNIWLDALIARIEAEAGIVNPRIGVSNVRFKNEFDRLTQIGFIHFHVMCSAKTWAARLAKDKKTPQSPSVNDISEQMAIGFDQSAMQQIKSKPTGPKLRVIWNDREAPAPSPRFITLADIAAAQA